MIELQISTDDGKTWQAVEGVCFRVCLADGARPFVKIAGAITADSVTVQSDPYGEDHVIEFNKL